MPDSASAHYNVGTALTAAGIYLVIEEFALLGVSLAVIALSSTFLKLNWYDRLRDDPDDPARTGPRLDAPA